MEFQIVHFYSYVQQVGMSFQHFLVLSDLQLTLVQATKFKLPWKRRMKTVLTVMDCNISINEYDKKMGGQKLG